MSDDDIEYMLSDRWSSISDSENDSDEENQEIDYPDEDSLDYMYENEESPRPTLFDSRTQPVLRITRLQSIYIQPPKNPTHHKPRRRVRPKDQPNHECAICLESCVRQNGSMRLFCANQCGNIFHAECIRSYTRSSSDMGTCPLCRTTTIFATMI